MHCLGKAEKTGALLCGGNALRSGAAAKHSQVSQRAAAEWQGADLQRQGEAKLRNAKQRQGGARLGSAMAWHSEAPRSSGLSVQRAGMLRRGIETLGMAKARQGGAAQGSGIEKRRRALQRHCTAQLSVGKAWPRLAMPGHSMDSCSDATAKPRKAWRWLCTARLGRAARWQSSATQRCPHSPNQIQPPQPIQRKRRTT